MPDGNPSSAPDPPREREPRRRFANLKTRLSRLRALILTTLGVPRGFFSQYAYAEQLQPVSEPYPEIEALCARAPWGVFLADMASNREAFRTFGQSSTDPELNRGMFPALDGMAAYAAVRRFRPNRIIEIGSGDSTHFLARAVRDNGCGQITCIDPQPRRSIGALDVNFLRRLMQEDDAELAAQLERNDILFVDSSHIMLPGMDVDIQFNRIFPRLRPGVLVHLHDVFLPDDYPAHWRVRNYSEQNALIGWLLGGYFEILWPAQFALTRHRGAIETALGGITPLTAGGSLWLRRPG